MVVISSTELSNNIEKYLNMAKTERIIIQHGRLELFELTLKNHQEESGVEDLEYAITGDELLKRITPRIEKLFDK
jgi:hypothetical protein